MVTLIQMMVTFFVKGALFQGKGGPPILEKPAPHGNICVYMRVSVIKNGKILPYYIRT